MSNRIFVIVLSLPLLLILAIFLEMGRRSPRPAVQLEADDKPTTLPQRQEEKKPPQPPTQETPTPTAALTIAQLYPTACKALVRIRLHESLNGKLMVGDGGLARGWLNQHEDNWNEGCEEIGEDWPWPGDTDDLNKCEWVAIGYWRRHCPRYLKSGTVEDLVRRFRLPYAPYRKDNDDYIRKVLGNKNEGDPQW